MLYTEEAIKNRQNKVNKIRKIISIIIYVFIALLLIFNISLVIQSVTNADKTPSFFGYKTYVITNTDNNIDFCEICWVCYFSNTPHRRKP